MITEDMFIRLVFLILGLVIGYAAGWARTAAKYAKAAKAGVQDVLIKVEKLEIKLDQEVDDIDGKINDALEHE
jgi:hypothetical protein